MRLLDAERPDEIYQALLAEILLLGFPKALLAAVDLETGSITPTVALKCSASYRRQFHGSLYAAEYPLTQAVFRMQPRVIGPGEVVPAALYCHPIRLEDKAPCPEAEHARGPVCLARKNFHGRAPLKLDQQACDTCGICNYVSLVVVELDRQVSAQDLDPLTELIGAANRHLTRLLKRDHAYARMTTLQEDVARMGRMMESVPDPIILTDTHHRVILQNKAAERFFKVTGVETPGRSRAVQMNNLLFSASLSSMAVSGGDTSRDLTLVDTIEGEEVLFEAVCAPTATFQGHTTGMVSVLRNITDLRRADEEVRANYEKLRSAEEIVRQDRDRLNLVFEHVGDPIVVCDSSAKVVLMDPLAKHLLGAADETAAPDAARLKNQARLDAYITAFTYSFTHRQTSPVRLLDPDSGAETEYDARSGKIYNERGQVEYTVTVLRDLTALKRIEQLKMERQLLVVDKFAATGRLAATIAHEINNPMEAIKNAIFLLGRNIPPQHAGVYEILKSETDRVSRIVRQMLSLYRSSPKPQIQPVNALIEDVLQLLKPQIQRSAIAIDTRLGSVPDVVCLPDQLRQVLTNLLINAYDSMSGGGRLLVRTRAPAADSGSRRVRVLIGDTGCGIPPAILPKVFEAFVTTKGERGTGLGLWITKNIIEGQGGTIRVKSRVGRGTVFRIDLPAAR